MISCDRHDYIEIACMYRLEVELVLKDGSQMVATPVDTLFNAQKEECISLTFADKSSKELVLDQLVSMRALTANPHFDCVVF